MPEQRRSADHKTYERAHKLEPVAHHTLLAVALVVGALVVGLALATGSVPHLAETLRVAGAALLAVGVLMVLLARRRPV